MGRRLGWRERYGSTGMKIPEGYLRVHVETPDDLHQGIVWGTQTEQTVRDPRLINRFDYDGDCGTVLHRLLMQAATR